jgi:hypothetical protein
MESEQINLPTYFLRRPGVFKIRNVEEYRLFLESYCIGKKFNYSYFNIKFNRYLLINTFNELIYNEETHYPDWVAMIRFGSSTDDYLTLDILRKNLEDFIEKSKEDEIISKIFS